MLKGWTREGFISVIQVSIVAFLGQIIMMDSIAVHRLHHVSQPLKIRLNHQSPPFIALLEVLDEEAEVNESLENLDDSSSFQIKANDYIGLKLDPLKIKSMEYATLRLKPIKVSRFAYLNPVSSDAVADGEERLDESRPSRHITFIESQWEEALSPRQRDRLRLASKRTQVLAQNWSIPDFTDLAQMKIFEAMTEPGEKKDEPRVIVKLPTQQAEPPIPWRSGSSPNTDMGGGKGTFRHIAKNDDGARPELADGEITPSADDSGGDYMGVASLDPGVLFSPAVEVRPKRKEQLPVRLTGPLYLTDGLALGSGGRLEVFREEEGYRSEEAFVDLTRASYEIDIPVRFGKLVAQVINTDGEIIGRGELNLSDYDEVSRAQGIYQGLKIALKPYREGLAGITASAYSFGDTQYAVSSQLEATGIGSLFVSNEEGSFHLPGVSSYSSFMIRAYSPTHAESLTTLVAGAENQVQLMPEKMLVALEKFLEDLG